MKYTCIKTVAIYLLATLPLLANASTHKVKITHSVMVGDGIAKFIPEGFDAQKKKNHANKEHFLPTGYLFPSSHSRMVKQTHH